MSLPLILADQRMAERRGIKAVIFGKSGIGKTSLLMTLDPATTLFIDLEAGDLAVEQWPGDTIRPRTWEECRDLAVFIGGPNPALREDQTYSVAHHASVVEHYGNPSVLDRYETIFIDSITVASRLSFQWCKGQPEAFAERSGKPDIRGAYGLHGREMLAWLVHLQHTRTKNIVFVGILDEKFRRMARTFELKDESGALYRAFVCQTINPFGLPAKDRSGRLDMIEEPHLGRLFSKIMSPAKPATERLTFERPASPVIPTANS